ncbi:MAG: hypothetical protein ACHQNT_01600 [Bacteroidia bacterium]
MKNKKTISKLIAAAAITVAFISSGFAQSNLGADCGCPPVASRTTVVLMSSLALSGGATDGDLIAANTILTCDKMWILDKKIYVPDGKSLTIQPGTVIKGNDTITIPANAAALIVTRGGKIFANGTPTCQIVFTAQSDNLAGGYGVANRGKWGGVCILGKSINNILPCNAFYGGSAGTAFIEGFSAANARDIYGGTDADDNSGIFRYVSIRHSGAIIATANELNGLSLGSVGRGTTIDHIEIISSDDDGIEVFGGTVNMKYVTTMFGADDGIDWDLGWTGKVQFAFNFQTDSITSPTGDNGFEADADDNKSMALPRSHPVIYNATMIGSGKRLNVGDNSGHNAINAKELTEGEIYNSVFGNFNHGLNLAKANGSAGTCGTYTSNAYANWIAGTLRVECNTFYMMNDATNAQYLVIDNAVGGVLAGDITKFDGDNNLHPAGAAPISGFDHTLSMNTSTNAIIGGDKFDAIPNPALSTTCTPPSDGFFQSAPYRGAFNTSGQSWLSPWAYATVLGVTAGLQPCPTDINADGVTNNADFLLLLANFNASCN